MAKITIRKNEEENYLDITIDNLVIGDSFATTAFPCEATDNAAVAGTTSRQQFRDSKGVLIDTRAPALQFPSGTPNIVNVSLDIPKSVTEKFTKGKIISDVQLTLPWQVAGENAVKTVAKIVINAIDDVTKPVVV